jgi:hypothetical protein
MTFLCTSPPPLPPPRTRYSYPLLGPILQKPFISFTNPKNPELILDIEDKIIPSSGDHHEVNPFAMVEDDDEDDDDKDALGAGSSDESLGNVSFSKQPTVILDVVGKIIPSSGDHHQVNPFAMVDDEDDDDNNSGDPSMSESVGHVSFL